LRDLEQVVVAYSGGVDSTFLLKAAVDTLGAENVLACTSIGPAEPGNQYERARQAAEQIGVELMVVEAGEMEDPKFTANNPDRCFHCKSALCHRLLDVAQERGFEHVIFGTNHDDLDDFRPGNQAIKADARVIAVTNRDLGKAISDRTFREDLFHRLNVFAIRVPPLRHHTEDIPRLADYFLARYADELGMKPPQISDEARDVLKAHAWTGNVRELEHCLHRAIIFTRGYPIQAQDIQSALESSQADNEVKWIQSVDDSLKEIVRVYLKDHSGTGTFAGFVERIEQLLLSEALRLSKGNQTRAAKHLGLARPTLKWKMDRIGPAKDPDPPQD